MPKSKVRKPRKKTSRRANPQSARRAENDLYLLPEGKSDPRPIREIPDLLEMMDQNLVIELEQAERLLAGSSARLIENLFFVFLTASTLASVPNEDKALEAHFADLCETVGGIMLPCAISQEKCGRIKEGLREAHDFFCSSKPQDLGSAELFAMSIMQRKHPAEVLRERLGVKVQNG